MDIKEAYDVLYEHLTEECNKQNICTKCLYHRVCELLAEMPPYVIGEFRYEYLKQTHKELINNPYIERVYANIGDKVLCIDNGGSYSTYDRLFKDNGQEEMLRRYTHRNLIPGIVYTVKGLYPHREGSCNVYILENDGGDIFLCTDSTDYLYKIQSDAKRWTDKSKARFVKIHDYYSLCRWNFHLIEGGHLFVKSNLTSRTLFITNAVKRSTKAIHEILDNFIKEDIVCSKTFNK